LQPSSFPPRSLDLQPCRRLSDSVTAILQRIRDEIRSYLVLRRRFRDCPDSDMAIATACLRLLTRPRRPRPLFSVPRLYSPMTRATLRRFAALRFAGIEFLQTIRTDPVRSNFRTRNEPRASLVALIFPASGFQQLCPPHLSVWGRMLAAMHRSRATGSGGGRGRWDVDCDPRRCI